MLEFPPWVFFLFSLVIPSGVLPHPTSTPACAGCNRQYIQRKDKSIYTAVLIEVVGRGDYDNTMNHWLKAEKDSSSGPEIATHQSRCQQNSASMQFNSLTSNKPMLHQPFLGREGYSQRNFAVTMMATRNNCWPVVNGIKWVLHPDTICNEARPGWH